MKSSKSFYTDIFHTKKSNFDELALNLFQYQATNNAIYKSFIENIGVQVNQIKEVEQIPFLPISFFKTQEVKAGSWEAQAVFESSGTTGAVTSKHYVRDLDFYLFNCREVFTRFYGPLDQFHFLALLPSYLERSSSSLVYMADYFIKQSNSPQSGFYLNDYEGLIATIGSIKDGRKVVLLGVTFALLDLAEQYKPDLSGVIVMETGGMKGRRAEMIREELHSVLKDGLGIDRVHSEYGMTELLSQAYSTHDGVFQCPPWMKIILRDINDPFDLNIKRTSGGINVIDLANIDTCAFIETQDMGRVSKTGDFEVIGRFDNSDIRGCNLMVY
ncbi:acyltransferase [Fulvivirga kasyanovii]|uniref:Acyl transferase n=1 Tax=Fulvivirga kasyanovii TaxID=396812 RepID=A0ABW9RV17_9BACT|nr:acyl transferase [Fulvivirga kasyanovii]MTI28037.1 acyl transferase [Fulvivirga kasyanovii]